MRVVATAVGFHGKLRQPGEIFDVAKGEKGSWFKPDTSEAKAKAEPEAARAKKPDDLV